MYYGADLNTGTVGSGFPRCGESDNPYATHKWNVNNFPKLAGKHESLLNHVDEAIQGVIVPWLYIGMCFSAFCWHVEDHMFYSINYNHYGAPKQWCGLVHAANSMRSCMPGSPNFAGDLLPHLPMHMHHPFLCSAAVFDVSRKFLNSLPRIYMRFTFLEEFLFLHRRSSCAAIHSAGSATQPAAAPACPTHPHPATACRYGVPSSAASEFESTFKACQPDLCANQPDVLFHLVTMLSPRRLVKHGVPVHSCLQNAGEFVITFPNAYHGGFNCGVNAAEAVNFVPADWLRFGAASQLRYRAFRKPGVLCHEELLLDATRRNESALTAFWVQPELSRAVDEEIQLRYNLWAAVRSSRLCVRPSAAAGSYPKPLMHGGHATAPRDFDLHSARLHILLARTCRLYLTHVAEACAGANQRVNLWVVLLGVCVGLSCALAPL